MKVANRADAADIWTAWLCGGKPDHGYLSPSESLPGQPPMLPEDINCMGHGLLTVIDNV